MEQYTKLFKDALEKAQGAIIVGLQDDPDVNHAAIAQMEGFAVVDFDEIKTGNSKVPEGSIGLIVTRFRDEWLPQANWRSQPTYYTQHWIMHEVLRARGATPDFGLIVLSVGMPEPSAVNNKRMPFGWGTVFKLQRQVFWQLTPRGELVSMRIETVEPSGATPRHFAWRVA